jgi:hypothetical protein
VVLSLVLGDYLDKREMQQSLDASVLPIAANDNEVWVDFVADTADGFDASYSVAWCVSQREIVVEGAERPLPRGDLLILGGDQVYPYATVKEYEDRFRGPYKTALPWCDDRDKGDLPRMLAIPGNHDWYDGLTGFMRMFAQGGWLGGWKLSQTRSYFAVNLPGPFWLWGIDIQNGAYLDVAQIGYFEDAAACMAAGDRLILCTAKPSWADVKEEPHAYDNLAWVEKTLVPDDVTTVLMISGDKHHYARYEPELGTPDARVRLTAGGGGAFLSATHKLDEIVEVPIPQKRYSTTPQANAEKEPFKLQNRYPEVRASRRLCPRALAVGWFNPVFMVMPALLHLLLFAANQSSLRGDPSLRYGDLLLGRFSLQSIALALLLWALLAAFFDAPKYMTNADKSVYRIAVGFVHTVAHVLVQGLIAWIALEVCEPLKGLAFVAATAAIVVVLGGVLGSLTFGIYLLVAFGLLGRHDTEAFSAFRYEGYKNFLRMCVTEEEITVYPIGIDKVCHEWELDPCNPKKDASCLKPAHGPIAMELIEERLIIR